MAALATTVKDLQCHHFENTSEEIQNFLHQLYTQLMHQPVAFTTGGFYTLNLSLLASIFTGITSYQIILVQFFVSTIPHDNFDNKSLTIDSSF